MQNSKKEISPRGLIQGFMLKFAISASWYNQQHLKGFSKFFMKLPLIIRILKDTWSWAHWSIGKCIID